jgi:hypothetical protein
MFYSLLTFPISLPFKIFDKHFIRTGLSYFFIHQSLKTLELHTIDKVLFKLGVSASVNPGLIVLADGHISTLVCGFGLMLPDSTPRILYADLPLFQGVLVLLRVKLAEIGLFERSFVDAAEDMLIDGRLLIGEVTGKLMDGVYLILLYDV